VLGPLEDAFSGKLTVIDEGSVFFSHPWRLNGKVSFKAVAPAIASLEGAEFRALNGGELNFSGDGNRISAPIQLESGSTIVLGDAVLDLLGPVTYAGGQISPRPIRGKGEPIPRIEEIDKDEEIDKGQVNHLGLAKIEADTLIEAKKFVLASRMMIDPGKTVTFNGDYIHRGNPSLSIAVGRGGQHGKLVVSGQAHLQGNLDVSPLYGTSLQVGDRFVIIEAKNVKGRFDSECGQGIPDGLSCKLDYSSTKVVLELVERPSPIMLPTKGN
jgi:hypothetical protein